MFHKYTWYGNDGKTRKKIDFILTEPFVQKYMTNCRLYRGINITVFSKQLCVLPTTRKARRRYNKNPTETKQDVKALHIPAIRRAFVESLDQKLQESKNPP